jgi:hypothetical protein
MTHELYCQLNFTVRYFFFVKKKSSFFIFFFASLISPVKDKLTTRLAPLARTVIKLTTDDLEKVIVIKKNRFFQEISYVKWIFFWRSGRQLKDLLKTVVKIRCCHLKKTSDDIKLFQGRQKQQTDTIIPSTESLLKSLVHLFLRFSRKSFVSILLVFPDFLDTLYVRQQQNFNRIWLCANIAAISKLTTQTTYQ